MKKILGILIYLIPGNFLFSQTHNFHIYNPENGFPQSQVHSICQDKRGFMWFGTDGGGLVKFDGISFKTISTAEGLCNDLVYSITEDKSGLLWIGSAKGISILKNDSMLTIPPVFLPLAELAVRDIKPINENQLIFCTAKGAYLSNKTELKKLPLPDSIVYTVFQDHKDQLWFGTANGVIVLNKRFQVQFRLGTGDGLGHNIVSALNENDDKRILIGTDRGAFIYDGFSLTKLQLPSPAGSKEMIRSIEYDYHGHLWIGTWDAGLYRFDLSGLTERYGKNEGLGIEGVFCSLHDREGNIWVGTDGNGIAKLGYKVFTTFSMQNGLPDDMVLSVFKDSKNRWWYGHSEGASMFDGKKYNRFTKQNGLSNDKVWSITEDKTGNIWICTYGSGIFIFSEGKLKSLDEKSGLISNNVRAAFHDESRTWIGTANGLCILENDSVKKIPYDFGTKRFLCFFKDSKHKLWIGTSGNGLALVKNRNSPVEKLSFKLYNEKSGMADNVILSIAEDYKGNIWTANFGGLSKLNPETDKIDIIGKKDGLTSNTVYVIAFTKDSFLLAGTNFGLDKININKYERNGKPEIFRFGKEEGFRGLECNTNSVFKDYDERIYFGTIKGIGIYHPELDYVNPVPPVTHITSIRLFLEETDFSKYFNASNPEFPYIFPYDKNHFTFDFVGLSYILPGKVRYKYMLEGNDKTWTPPRKINSASYSNLPPGKYRFKVMSCSGDGVWSEEVASFAFIIKPPFWMTWWFITSSSCFVILVTGFYIKRRIERTKKTEAMLREQVALRTRELQREKEIVEEQHKEIEKKNRSITSSIQYAKRIQDSILPLRESFRELIPESFILFKPKDIVSGDFYWFCKHPKTNEIICAVVDCTGHGVPGAFMSLIGNNLLHEIILTKNITSPSKIFTQLHEGLIQTLKKNEVETGTVDGMDITMFSLDLVKRKITFSSTGRPFVLISDNKKIKFKLGKHPVGLHTGKEIIFEEQTIDIKKGDCFYLSTDGFADQFGGKEEDKFLDLSLEELYLKIHAMPMEKQSEILNQTIEEWKGKLPQLDDILVIGIRV